MKGPVGSVVDVKGFPLSMASGHADRLLNLLICIRGRLANEPLERRVAEAL